MTGGCSSSSFCPGKVACRAPWAAHPERRWQGTNTPQWRDELIGEDLGGGWNLLREETFDAIHDSDNPRKIRKLGRHQRSCYKPSEDSAARPRKPAYRLTRLD